MTYTVRFFNGITKEVFCFMEFETKRLTKREWDVIIQTLFNTACEGVDNRILVADVFHNTMGDVMKMPMVAMGIMSIYCETISDGETIDAYISANCTHIRK